MAVRLNEMLQRAGAMRMGAVMMRESNLYLTAALSGLMVVMFLLGVILVRGAEPAEKADQLTTVFKHSEARATLDIGVADLRGTLP
jgi:hypothetical protein